MKKIYYFLILSIALFFVGCNHSNNVDYDFQEKEIKITNTEKLKGKKLSLYDMNDVLNENFDNSCYAYIKADVEHVPEHSFNLSKESWNKKVSSSNELTDNNSLDICTHSYSQIDTCSHPFIKYRNTTSLDNKLIIEFKVDSWNKDYIYSRIFDILKFLDENFDMSNYYYTKDMFGDIQSRDFLFIIYGTEINHYGEEKEGVTIANITYWGQNLDRIVWTNIDTNMLRNLSFEEVFHRKVN